MAEIIRMPKMSDTMTEGVIAAWLVKVGDKVKAGDVLAEVETDKATMELENYIDGVVLHIGVDAKQAAAVDGLIAIIGKAGEDISGLVGGAKPAVTPAPVAEVKQESKATVSVAKIDVKAVIVRMPKMSDTMTEGTIAKWLKNVGDTVKSGDILGEVETDKATMELENYENGVLLYKGAEEGNAIPVDGVLAIIGEKDADYKQLLNAPAQTQALVNEVVSTPTANVASSQSDSAPQVSSSDSRVKASPLAKSLAKEKGYDLTKIVGSGENGRIIKKDVESYKPAVETPKTATTSTASVVSGQESFTEVPVSQMRKVIAKRLSESKFTAPHFYLSMEINMDKAMSARTSMNEFSAVKISFNDMVVKAAAVAIRKNPDINSSWRGDKIRYNQHIHIGVAMAVPDGLLVPVVRFADTLSLSQIASATKELGQKAKNKKLQPSDWEGNTFSISNLGMFGIDEFTAIVNPPDACILAVGGIKEVPVVKNGQIQIGNVMKVTLSCDHRVVDGAVGASFLQTLKTLLEDPIKILV
ncbi:MAG: pyruvate dehydrogenase complex dihydrolipoamide acetyltransferase [Bacteroidetes bacterium]|nr:MAG: pyruvate dehydrogenase complex dihydrolipoamide acetyltransferase [Bacteroidota bacterium]